MIKYYNKKYKDKIFRIKDKVLFLFKYIRMRRTNKKLINKFLRLFKIIVTINKSIYQLELFKNYNKIHFIFHVSLLKHYKRRKDI